MFYLFGLGVVGLCTPLAWILDWILEPIRLQEKRIYELVQEHSLCFICLDPMKDMIYVRQLNHCQCQIRVHHHCWNQWKSKVKPFSCPLCRQS